ncbi:hypothetical protein IWW48_006398 [Coemansia sp. RSA 1200]|nr:hypothetical protein IWW48_006398 [Coemansia sp. RSA 1200]
MAIQLGCDPTIIHYREPGHYEAKAEHDGKTKTYYSEERLATGDADVNYHDESRHLQKVTERLAMAKAKSPENESTDDNTTQSCEITKFPSPRPQENSYDSHRMALKV